MERHGRVRGLGADCVGVTRGQEARDSVGVDRVTKGEIFDGLGIGGDSTNGGDAGRHVSSGFLLCFLKNLYTMIRT